MRQSEVSDFLRPEKRPRPVAQDARFQRVMEVRSEVLFRTGRQRAVGGSRGTKPGTGRALPAKESAHLFGGPATTQRVPPAAPCSSRPRIATRFAPTPGPAARRLPALVRSTSACWAGARIGANALPHGEPG